jgi:hypothetical protein
MVALQHSMLCVKGHNQVRSAQPTPGISLRTPLSPNTSSTHTRETPCSHAVEAVTCLPPPPSRAHLQVVPSPLPLGAGGHKDGEVSTAPVHVEGGRLQGGAVRGDGLSRQRHHTVSARVGGWEGERVGGWGSQGGRVGG